MSNKKKPWPPPRKPTPPPNREDPEVREFLDDLAAMADTPKRPPPPEGKATASMPAVKQRELTELTKPRPLVLIVDDDLDICEVLREVLVEDAKPDNFEVEFAHNGLEAVTTMDRLRSEGRMPCCVLLDLTMPEYPGWSYIGFAERCWMFEVPFRLISAATWDDSNKMDHKWVFLERYRRGGYEIIQKPFRGPEQIISVVREACAERMSRLPPY